MSSNPIKVKVQADGSKLYWFRVDIGIDPVTGRRRQKYHSGLNPKEVKAEYAKITHGVFEGTFVQPSKLTLNAYLDTWVRSKTRGLEKHSIRSYQDSLRCARERLGDRELQKITRADIEDLVDWMETSGRKRGGKPGTGLGPRSIELMLSKLRAALNEAVDDGLLVRNPAARVKGSKRRRGELVPWEADEVRQFIAATVGERLHAVMYLSLLGMRPEEVCGLRWSDINFDAATLKISNVRTLVEGEVDEKETKSPAGKRPLPIPAEPLAALKSFKAKQAAEKLAAGEAYNDGGYVTVDEIGVPLKTDRLRREFYRLIKVAGLRKVRLYDARHACLTYLAISHVPDVIVSRWAGHADLSFTKRRYIHPSPEDLVQGRDALDKLFGTNG